MDPDHLDADPDSTYHPDLDPDPDPIFKRKNTNPLKRTKIGAYSIHCGWTSPNCCGSGSGFSLSL